MSSEDKLNQILAEVKEIKSSTKELDRRMDEMEKKYVEAASMFKTIKWGLALVAGVLVFGWEAIAKIKWW